MNQQTRPTHSGERRRILAFEPFDGGSHRAVRQSISHYSQHEWQWVTRPPRNWKWRMRIGAIEMVEIARDQGMLEQPFDALFVTSLLSAADLRALLPERFRGLPLVLYMHENQAAYPLNDIHRDDLLPHERDVQFMLTNLSSILAADRVLWNSQWNRDSFLAGLAELLRMYPERGKPALQFDDALIERLKQRRTICWPPVELPPGVLT